MWPDWPLLQSYHERVWAIVDEHLQGREEFEPAAARIATILREQVRDPRSSRPRPPINVAAGDRPMWMMSLPVPSVGDADKPRVSRLFERACELSVRPTDKGAA